MRYIPLTPPYSKDGIPIFKVGDLVQTINGGVLMEIIEVLKNKGYTVKVLLGSDKGERRKFKAKEIEQFEGLVKRHWVHDNWEGIKKEYPDLLITNAEYR